MLAATRDPNARAYHETRDADRGCPQTVEQLIRTTRLIFSNAGITMRPAKVADLVRTYKRKVEPNGFAFIDYLVNCVLMTEWQRRVVADELTKIISYSDPTGEQAVNRVMRGAA